MTDKIKKERDFSGRRAQAVMGYIRRTMKRLRHAMNVHEVADVLQMTPRQAREYLNHMHQTTKEIFIEHYVESTAQRGKKLPCFRLKRTGNEVDAPKWWLTETVDSEGGDCD